MRHWEGPIFLYNTPTVDLREIRPSSDILTPFSVPVFAKGDHEIVGHASCFRANKFHVTAYIAYEDDKIHAPMRGKNLYPGCDFDLINGKGFDFDSEKGVFVIRSGILRAITLDPVPVWQTSNGTPAINPVVIKSMTRR